MSLFYSTTTSSSRLILRAQAFVPESVRHLPNPAGLLTNTLPAMGCVDAGNLHLIPEQRITTR